MIEEGRSLFEQSKYKESLRQWSKSRTCLSQFSWFKLDQIKVENEYKYNDIINERDELREYTHFMSIYT